ncbi:MAG: folylpolyglutamate synthase [Rickettsiaceae bacterium]|nr:folylpolyglutamate synthase [Rickettsiaceae bacterium]
MGAPLFAFGYDWVAEKTDTGMIFKSKDGDIELPRPALLGDHQIINAGAAIAAAKQLTCFNIPDSAIAKGLQNAKWMARMQKLTTGKLVDRLPEDWEVWLDGAHNMAGAHIVSCILDDWKDKPTYIISGFTRNRSAYDFFKCFVGKVKFIGGVVVETELSAQTAETVAEAATSLGIPAKAFDSIEDAMHYLPSISKEPARVLFCGSLYLASDALKANK